VFEDERPSEERLAAELVERRAERFEYVVGGSEDRPRLGVGQVEHQLHVLALSDQFSKDRQFRLFIDAVEDRRTDERHRRGRSGPRRHHGRQCRRSAGEERAELGRPVEGIGGHLDDDLLVEVEVLDPGATEQVVYRCDLAHPILGVKVDGEHARRAEQVDV
jgi:hypothetical protein